MPENHTLSLVMPVYNEEGIIKIFLTDCLNELKKIKKLENFEIIIINDNSTDNSLKKIEEISEENTNIKIINLEKNMGAGHCVKLGLKSAKFKWVLTIDSDGQFPAENISILFNYAIENNCDVVSGARNKKDKITHVYGSKISTKICNIIFGTNLRDFNSILKLMKREIVQKVDLVSKRMNISTEITAKIILSKHSLNEINCLHINREFGRSSSSFFKTSFSRSFFILYLFMIIVLKKY